MRLNVEIKTYLSSQKSRIEKALQEYIPAPVAPFTEHIEAIRYSLFAGGKRVRPILCLAAGEAVCSDSAAVDNLLPVACALECIHTYSLIHDDLPAMDNDDLRRGKPTNHVLHGEAGAILAGDGLLTLAFELLSAPTISTLSAEKRLEMTYVIARASGSFGMVGGQALDIAHENKEFPFEMLQTIHSNKTGALIIASIHCGAIGCNADRAQTDALLEYGKHLGLAFQIVDDLLDVTATTAQLGKHAGNDKILGKATYPAYFGVEETRTKARNAIAKAQESIAHFTSQAEPLRLLADYVYERTH